MPPLLQRLLTVCIRRRIVLRYLQLIGEFDDLTASAFSLAFEIFYKLTHVRPIRRTSVIAITVLLNVVRATGLQQIVHKLAVVASVGSRQTPVVVGKLGRHSAPTIASVPNRRTFFLRCRRGCSCRDCSPVFSGRSCVADGEFAVPAADPR